MLRNSRLLWSASRKPPKSEHFYGFTFFTMLLNEPAAAGQHLPRTDCRLRPDIRLLEQGELAAAAREKERLEEKQRAARKRAKAPPKAGRWFRHVGKDAFGRDGQYEFEDKYWDRQATLSEAEEAF